MDTYPRGKRPFPKVKYEANYEFYDPQDNFCSANFRTIEKDKETGKDYLHVAVVFRVEKKKPQTGVRQLQSARRRHGPCSIAWSGWPLTMKKPRF